jgi:hypothetical protein
MTREAVTLACRAGGDCGACHGMIATMIEDHQEAVGTPAGPGPSRTRCPREDESGQQLIPDAALLRTVA